MWSTKTTEESRTKKSGELCIRLGHTLMRHMVREKWKWWMDTSKWLLGYSNSTNWMF